MTLFTPTVKTNLRAMATGALYCAKNGVVGSTLVACASGASISVGSLSTIALASAVGGALVMLPMIWLASSISSQHIGLHPILHHLLVIGNAVAGAVTGALLFGLPLMPLGIAALTASFAFLLFNDLSVMIYLDRYAKALEQLQTLTPRSLQLVA